MINVLYHFLDDKAVSIGRKDAAKNVKSGISPDKRKSQSGDRSSLTWTEKYRPKLPNDIIGNQSIVCRSLFLFPSVSLIFVCRQLELGYYEQVKQLHDWLMTWDEHFLHAGKKGKGKKQSDSGSKKAVLLSGSPGIGKSTSAKLVSQMIGFQAIEVSFVFFFFYCTITVVPRKGFLAKLDCGKISFLVDF